MKKTILFVFSSLLFAMAQAQDSTALDLNELEEIKAYIALMDSVEKAMNYETGEIELEGGIAKLTVPEGYKYLNGEQADYVLTEIWGNPADGSHSLGFLLPDSIGVYTEGSFVFNIEYDGMGYVKDDDADDIDYDEMIVQLRDDAKEENKIREENGYAPIEIVGWASEPYYDGDKKILHWAKEIKFGEAEVNTLNYNVRVLGRKGVLVLNAIATMDELPLVKESISPVIASVAFNEGYTYKEFDSSIDNVAAWSIGGLVAGKVLAKTGILVGLLKFWKIIALAIAGFFGTIWKKISGKKEERKGPIS